MTSFLESAHVVSHVPPTALHLLVALHPKYCVSWDFALAGYGVLDFSHLVKVAHLRLPGRPVIVQNTTADQATKVLKFLAGKRAT